MRDKAIEKAHKRLWEEEERQVMLLYPVFAIALNRLYGWKAVRINKIFERTRDVWDECGEDINLSILGMLYDETGIEMKLNGTDKHFWELAIFNSKICVGNPKKKMTDKEVYFMRQAQIKWCGCCVQSALLLSLKRREKFGNERMAKVFNEVCSIRAEYNDNTKLLWVEAERLTGLRVKKSAEEYF